MSPSLPLRPREVNMSGNQKGPVLVLVSPSFNDHAWSCSRRPEENGLTNKSPGTPDKIDKYTNTCRVFMMAINSICNHDRGNDLVSKAGDGNAHDGRDIVALDVIQLLTEDHEANDDSQVAKV